MSKGYFNLRTLMAVGAMIALAACGGNSGTSNNVPSNGSVDTGIPASTAEAASGNEAGGAVTGTDTAGTVGTESTNGANPAATPAPTDASAVSGGANSNDTGTGNVGSSLGTVTPDASAIGAGGTAAGTPLTGPNISYNGITFDVDQSTTPSVTVQNGSVNMMGAGSTSGSTSTAGSGTLSGTIFTFEGMNMGASSSGASSAGSSSGSMTSMFQPRIVVIPVSQLVSYESAMMAQGAIGASTSSSNTSGSTNGNATPEATTSSSTSGSSSSTTGTATPEASVSGSTSGSTSSSATGEGMNANLFITELSRTLASQSAFPSTSMANSMVLTRALSLMGVQGYTPAFQSNGEFLNFKNGRGVRFVTAFQPQDSNPAALNQLYYMFHGLTNDNQYYVMALMPLQSSVIGTGASAGTMGSNTSGSTSSSSTTSGTATPAAGTTMTGTTGTGSTGTGNSGAIQFPSSGDASAYQSYLDQVVAGLDQAAAGSNDAAFSQSLQQYDTLIQSLNVSASAQ